MEYFACVSLSEKKQLEYNQIPFCEGAMAHQYS